MIHFSETFKALRKDKNLTQEQMAEIFNVSPQAISRWETGSTYPDITLLPIIADFFGLSIDDLLGSSQDKIKARVDYYMSEFQLAISKGHIQDCIELMRTALKELPNNYLLLSNLMYALYVASEDETLCKRYDEEIISIGERILNYCHEDSIRMETKRLLFRHYCDTNRKPKARSIVDTLPEENASKETNIYWLLEGDERMHYLKERISVYTNHLLWAIWALAMHSNETEEKINALQSVLHIEKTIYQNEDYGFQFYTQARIHATLSELYLDVNQLEQATYHARLAANAAISYESLSRVTMHTSPLIKGLVFNKDEEDTSDTRNLCQELYEDYFSKICFNPIRQIEPIENLKGYF